MYRENVQDELIDLGAASETTRGVAIGGFDSEATLRPYAGLTDD